MSLLSLSAQDPLGMSALAFLLTSLGLSSTAGLRAYLPLLVVGLAGAGSTPLIPLQPSFSELGNPVMLIVLGVLVVGEFIADKIPIVDHISDLVHTLFRPLSGAIIMASTQNTLSDIQPWIAAAVGAVLALGVHGFKSTSRHTVTVATVGHGNTLVSLAEDVGVVAAILLMLFAPVIGAILIVAVALAAIRLMRGIKRRFSRRNATSAGTVVRADPVRRSPRISKREQKKLAAVQKQAAAANSARGAGDNAGQNPAGGGGALGAGAKAVGGAAAVGAGVKAAGGAAALGAGALAAGAAAAMLPHNVPGGQDVPAGALGNPNPAQQQGKQLPPIRQGMGPYIPAESQFAPTIGGDNPGPYRPPAQVPNPIAPSPLTGPTQGYPPNWPDEGGLPLPYPGDGPTLPGSRLP